MPAMNSHTRVSVVIPVARFNNLLLDLLRSLASQKIPPFEVIIVTPRLDSSFLETIKRLPFTVRIIELCNDPGPIRSRVFGALAASSPLVAFIDSDCLAPPNWLNDMVKELEKYDVEVVAGSVKGVNLDRFIPRALEKSIISPNPKHSRKILKRDINLSLIVTANMLIKRKILFDDDVIPPNYGRFGFEDLDLATRIVKKGYSILCTPVYVLHYNRTSITTTLKRFYEYGRGLPLYRSRTGGSTYSLIVSLLCYAFILLNIFMLFLAAMGNLSASLFPLLLVFLPLFSYHLFKIKDGGFERLLYPLFDFLLIAASSVGVAHSDFENILLKIK